MCIETDEANQKKPIISVIVPVYNAEKYLHRCVDSILGQTFTDFELILVDDGSTDCCCEICDLYAARDNRVKVIHQENHGAAAARNVGISCSCGKYLAFCDSDDMVSDLWLDHMIELADEDTLVVGAYTNVASGLGRNKQFDFILPEIRYPILEYSLFRKCGIAGYFWNALYHRNTIIQHGIAVLERKEKGDYNEDLTFALNYASVINNVVYTGYADYCYDVREGSLSRSNIDLYYEKYNEKYCLWSEFIKRCTPHERQRLAELSTEYLYHYLVSIKRFADSNDFARFCTVVESEQVEHCIKLADATREDKRVISMLRQKRVKTLWLFYKLVKMKGAVRK